MVANKDVTCYECEEVGRIKPNIPNLKGAIPGETTDKTNGEEKITCYDCDEVGHIKANIPKLKGPIPGGATD